MTTERHSSLRSGLAPEFRAGPHVIPLLLAGSALLGSATPVMAEIITYNFSGTVDSASGSVDLGSRFSGTFTYDTSTPNSSSTTTLGTYLETSTLTVSSGSFGFATDTDLGSIIVGDSFPSGPDQFSISLNDASPPAVSGAATAESVQFDFHLLDHYDGNVINSVSLPLTLNVSDFDSRQFSIEGFNQNPSGPGYTAAWSWSGTINQITQVSSVPEPASLALFAIGGLGLIGCCRQFKRKEMLFEALAGGE